MREYSKVYKQFWTGNTGMEIKQYGAAVMFLSLYFTTNHHVNMLGIYYLPISYIVDDTQLPLEIVQKGLNDLSEIGFCKYDNKLQYIWICEMASEQIGSLDEKDNRIKNIKSIYDSLPNLPFLEEFYDRYHEYFHLKKRNKNDLTKGIKKAEQIEQVREITGLNETEEKLKDQKRLTEINETKEISSQLQSPFEDPSKPLRSSFEDPSKPLRSTPEALLAANNSKGQSVQFMTISPKIQGEYKKSTDPQKSEQKCGFQTPFEAPSKPLRSPFEANNNNSNSNNSSNNSSNSNKEQKQEQKHNRGYRLEKEKKINEKRMTKEISIVEQARHFLKNEILEIFEFWQKTMNHPNAKLDDKRKSIIQKFLKMGYSPEDLKKAITGCSYTPHNMGDNTQGQRYDGLHVIFKDADQVDRFIANYQNPPHPLTKAEAKTKENITNSQIWLEKKLEQERRRQQREEEEQAEDGNCDYEYEQKNKKSNQSKNQETKTEMFELGWLENDDKELEQEDEQEQEEQQKQECENEQEQEYEKETEPQP